MPFEHKGDFHLNSKGHGRTGVHPCPFLKAIDRNGAGKTAFPSDGRMEMPPCSSQTGKHGHGKET
jgi:hypothetical protein